MLEGLGKEQEGLGKVSDGLRKMSKVDLEKTLMRIHGGLDLRLRSFYKVYQKRLVIPLNKTHSASSSPFYYLIISS